MKIDVQIEDYQFLKELQHELNTQDTDGNAQPVYWGVIETKKVGVPDGFGEPKIFIGDGNVVDIEEAIEKIDEDIYEFSESTKKIWEEAVNKQNMDSVVYFAQEYLEWEDWRVINVRDKNSLVENTGSFLTKRACQKYIDNNRHNLTNPHTYAMTALRNKEFERVLSILRNMTFE